MADLAIMGKTNLHLQIEGLESQVVNFTSHVNLDLFLSFLRVEHYVDMS